MGTRRGSILLICSLSNRVDGSGPQPRGPLRSVRCAPRASTPRISLAKLPSSLCRTGPAHTIRAHGADWISPLRRVGCSTPPGNKDARSRLRAGAGGCIPDATCYCISWKTEAFLIQGLSKARSRPVHASVSQSTLSGISGREKGKTEPVAGDRSSASHSRSLRVFRVLRAILPVRRHAIRNTARAMLASDTLPTPRHHG
jgi:hypothetical protein